MPALASVARTAPEGASERLRAAGVVIEAGLDEDQMVALRALHRAWAVEEFGHDMDEEAWARLQWGLVNSGQYNVLIAWAGDEPVGCVEMIVQFDPISRDVIGNGDRAFVAEEWRGRGVFSGLVDAVYNLGVAMGCTKTLLPVGVDETGQMLQAMYERRGFEVSGLTMKRVPSCLQH